MKKGACRHGEKYQYTATMDTLTFKAPTEVAAFIRRQAGTSNTSVSNFIRATFEGMMPKQRARIGGRPGRALVHMPPGTPKITNADLDEAAEDY